MDLLHPFPKIITQTANQNKIQCSGSVANVEDKII